MVPMGCDDGNPWRRDSAMGRSRGGSAQRCRANKTPPVKEALATFKRFDIAYRLVTDAPCLLQSSMSSAVIVAYGLNSGSEAANCCCVARIGSS